MKIIKWIVIGLALMVSVPLFAGGMSVSSPGHSLAVGGTPAPAVHGVSVTIYPGSVKKNIQRLATYFGWKNLVWHADGDFNWVGKTKMHAKSFVGIMQKLLANYPLQAQFYEGNHVMVIVVRTLK